MDDKVVHWRISHLLQGEGQYGKGKSPAVFRADLYPDSGWFPPSFGKDFLNLTWIVQQPSMARLYGISANSLKYAIAVIMIYSVWLYFYDWCILVHEIIGSTSSENSRRILEAKPCNITLSKMHLDSTAASHQRMKPLQNKLSNCVKTPVSFILSLCCMSEYKTGYQPLFCFSVPPNPTLYWLVTKADLYYLLKSSAHHIFLTEMT